MPARPPVSLEELQHYPRMTSWFNPGLLTKLLWKVIVSDLFGQYADRRLIVAALDTVPEPDDPAQEPELVKRARKLKLEPDPEGAVWIDFVADLGDGFDATYAIATLLAKDSHTIAGHTLPRGRLLVMGGDEVYPLASAEDYQKKLRDPYGWAFPDTDPREANGVPCCAIPGNHDWYDGLTVFLALFARQETLHLGNWRSCQRRSYFAFELTPTWWLWCLDTQLDDDIDQPQKDYFAQIARHMPEHAKIIMCGPEPGWLYTKGSLKALEIIDYAIGIANAARKSLTIPIVLSGDTHHYSRYYAKQTNTHFVTSGGGGAFLHPTHGLEDEIEIRWLNKKVQLSLKTEPGPAHAPNETPACYPSRQHSRGLLGGDILFAFRNWGFSLLLGAIYFVFAAMMTAREHPDVRILTYVVLVGGMLGYFIYQEKKRIDVKIAAVIHGSVHFAAVVILTEIFLWVNEDLLSLTGYPWLLVLALEVGLTGAVVAGSIFGAYLLITCGWFNMNHNDAFSAMRLDSHRHFLRIRIKDDEVRIFAVGLHEVPRRADWRLNPHWKAGSPTQPAYVPPEPLRPHLIENEPIVIRV
jgi:hypothetical protein